jgi:hypothetical protein
MTAGALVLALLVPATGRAQSAAQPSAPQAAPVAASPTDDVAPATSSPSAAAQDSSAALPATVGPKEEYEEESYDMIEVEEIEREDLLDKPMNLARWIMGARLFTYETGHLEPVTEDYSDNTSAAALLTKDPNARYPMYLDSYKFVIDLGDYWMINMFEFMNYGAAGRAQVFYSDVLQDPNSGKWKAASPIVPFSGDGKVSLYLGALDTRFIMLVIDNMAHGDIGPFSVYGDLKISQMRLAGGSLSQKELEALPFKEREKYRPMRYDWATLHSGCRVSYVTSGDPRYSNAMIDDDMETVCQFKQEPETIVIMDMMEERNVNRMSMLFSSDPGLFEMYFVHKLPDGLKTDQDEQAAPPTEIIGESPATEESAALFRKSADGLYLASDTGSLSQWLALAQLGQMPDTADTTDEVPIKITRLPKEFFKETKPNLTYVSDGGMNSFRIEFQEITGRWCIIRFLRNFNSPTPAATVGPGKTDQPAAGTQSSLAPVRIGPHLFAPSPLVLLGQSEGGDGGGLRIYEVSIFGDIYVIGNALEPVEGVQFGSNSQSNSPGGGTGGGTPGGGGGPEVPPPDSPPPQDPDPLSY